ANRRKVVGEDGKESEMPQAVVSLKARFRGTMLLLFGEKTLSSARYRIHIDGEQVCERNASAKRFGGSTHLSKTVATGLDAGVDHALEIEPLFGTDKAQELRLESVCVAGPGARVRAAE
ncbi:MAG: hypothetical protein ACYTFI_00225, partial [Planctomycetota bacterium]